MLNRDAGAQVRIKLISPTTYNSRHSLTVLWSKDQEVVVAPYLQGFNVRSGERRTIIEMINVAAVDQAQSEGYVSTAGLFVMFSTSPKEEKAVLKLPPAFRDLWQEFTTAKQEHLDAADRDIVKRLRQVVQIHQADREDEEVVLTAGFRNRSKAASGVSTPVAGERQMGNGDVHVSPELKDLWQQKLSAPAFQQMLHMRRNLPMFQFRDVALSAVRQNQVLILCGETGCGKSTQMPSFILEDELSHGRNCKIYCTEPRRISAISLAQRVSEELGEGKGSVGTNRSLVGYAIRLESQTTASTRLTYATVGIVLRMLESEQGLKDITHLVIDEVHERR